MTSISALQEIAYRQSADKGFHDDDTIIVGNGDTADDKHWWGFRPDLLKEFAL